MTNRARLFRAANDLQQIKRDPIVGPSPYDHLTKAVEQMMAAAKFCLDYEDGGTLTETLRKDSVSSGP